jgi:hypothetical protein
LVEDSFEAGQIVRERGARIGFGRVRLGLIHGGEVSADSRPRLRPSSR